jgi:hypothetical protein
MPTDEQQHPEMGNHNNTRFSQSGDNFVLSSPNINRPDAIITVLPASISLPTGSSKIIIAIIKAKIRRVYLKGTTTATSPDLVARTTARYPIEPAKVPKERIQRSTGVTITNEPKNGAVISPAMQREKNDQKEIVTAGIAREIERVIVSLIARKSTAITPRKDVA